MMKIGVCDDNAQDILQIQDAFDKIKYRYELDVLYYGSGEELISAANENKDISLVILDIYMSGLDGIETARRIRGLIPGIHTAFLTTSSDHAVEAFDLGALHYIIKPVTAEKLHELIKRFYGLVHIKPRNVELKSKTKTYTFNLLQVQKITSRNKGVDVYLKNCSTIHIPETFSAIENQLDSSVFLKISRGLAVNMSYILCMTGDMCRFKDGTETLISRRDKNDIRRRYNDYLFDTTESSYDGT